MSILDKVSRFPNICEIELDFAGSSIPYISLQDTITSNAIFVKTHFIKSNVQFSEDGKETSSGLMYQQKMQIVLNSNDENRSERLMCFHKVKHILIKLTNGEKFLMGRNDFFQNKKPICTTSNTHQRSVVEFYTESIIPISKYLGNAVVGLPDILPVNFNID